MDRGRRVNAMMAYNPQRIAPYQMDDQSRQNVLDKNSASYLQDYMAQSGYDNYWPGIGNMVTGFGASALGLGLGSAGQPWFGIPLMAAGGVQMAKGKGQYDKADEYYNAADMWGVDPFRR